MTNIKDNYEVMFTDYPDVVDVIQMKDMLGGIGITLAYNLVREKKIHSVKVGREYRIPKTSIISYLVKSE